MRGCCGNAFGILFFLFLGATNGAQNADCVQRFGTPALCIMSADTPLTALCRPSVPPGQMHLCLTVECITSGLHLSVF